MTCELHQTLYSAPPTLPRRLCSSACPNHLVPGYLYNTNLEATVFLQ
jgi:hypothetical protein